MIYSFRIIPYRGSWLEGAFDSNDLIYIYIAPQEEDGARFWPRPSSAIGYSSNADIIEEFFDTRKVKIKSEKDFAKYLGKILAQDVLVQ